MYYSTTVPVNVPVPDSAKHEQIKILSTGYVYWITESHWDNSKKCTIDNRKSIGRIIENSGTPKTMYPSKTYFEIFANSQMNQKENTVADESNECLSIPGKFDTSLSYGGYVCLEAAAKKIGCFDALNSIFPNECLKILAIAYHSILGENSIAQGFPGWSFHNYCGIGTKLEGSDIGELYVELSKDESKILRFIENFKENYISVFNNADEMVVALDSTNQNTYSLGIDKAEYGHSKVNEGIPTINTAMIVDERTGIPLYYEHFCGSLLDKTQTPYTIEKAANLGFDKLFFMMDRGYCDKKCIDSFKNMHFGVMVPESISIVNSMIKSHAASIVNQEKYYIECEKVYGIHVPNIVCFDNTYDAYLFYDAGRAQKERDAIHSKVRFMKSELLKRKKYTDKLKTLYSPWLEVLHEKDLATGKTFRIIENTEKIQEEIDKTGLFVILSNTGLKADKMIQIARLRDTNEKGFRRLKYHFELSKTYVHSDEAYEGKMFVAYIALIIVEAFRYYIQSILNRKSSATIATVLSELSKYMIMQKKDGKWMPKYAMTKYQKEIIQCFEIDEDDVVKRVRQLRLQI